MNILALDCSSPNISLYMAIGPKKICSMNRISPKGSSRLIVYIEKYLKKAGAKIGDFDLFVIGSGPGSFTGLRISFSIIKGFAIASGKPVIPISSFFSCAWQVRKKAQKITVISDARKNLLYQGNFISKNGLVKKISPVKLTDRVSLCHKDNTLIVTYDPHLREELIRGSLKSSVYPKDIYPKAEHLAVLAAGLDIKKECVSINKLKPLYIHPDTCQIRARG